MSNSVIIVQQHYDKMWQCAADAIANGSIDIDERLPEKLNDNRRGYSLAIRPNADVQDNVSAFLDELRQYEPNQYYYRPGEFHITLLSLFTATEDHNKYFSRYDDFYRAVKLAFVNTDKFTINFRGITASPGAIIIQGFPDSDMLEKLRDSLRKQLRAAGLGEGLDKRYRIQTAHMTVARFQHQLNDRKQLLEFLEENRHRNFGNTVAKEVLFVENDWYMSEDKIRVLAKYNL